MTRTEPLTQAQIEILSKKLKDSKRWDWGEVFAIALLAVFFIIMPGKHGHPSLWVRLGGFKSFCCTFAVLFLVFFFQKLLDFRQLKADLATQKLKIEALKILRKEHSRMSGKFLLFFETKIRAFQKFEVSREVYESLAVGDGVEFRYLNRSQLLLSTFPEVHEFEG